MSKLLYKFESDKQLFTCLIGRYSKPGKTVLTFYSLSETKEVDYNVIHFKAGKTLLKNLIKESYPNAKNIKEVKQWVTPYIS